MRTREFIKPLLREYNRDITLRNQKIRNGIFMQFASNWPRGIIYKVSQDQIDSIVNRVMDEIESTEIPGVPKNYFAPWLAKWFSVGYFNPSLWSDFFDNGWRFRGVIPLLEAFYKYKDKGWFPKEYKDIYKLNPEELDNVIANLKIPEITTTNRGNTEAVLDNSELRILRILDKNAAIYYGQGTNPRWCTSYTDSDNRFDEYNKRGPLYVLLPKNPRYVGEKYQMHFDNNRRSLDEYTDERNREIGFFFLTNRFGKEFTEWLVGLRPEFKNTMLLSDDETILQLWQGFGDYVYGSFYEMGMGLIDDAATFDNDEDYLTWARLTRDNIMKIWSNLRNMSIDEIRKEATDAYDEDQSAWEITEIQPMWDRLFDHFAKSYELNEYRRPHKLIDLYDVLVHSPYIVKAADVNTDEVLTRWPLRNRKRIGEYLIGILG